MTNPIKTGLKPKGISKPVYFKTISSVIVVAPPRSIASIAARGFFFFENSIPTTGTSKPDTINEYDSNIKSKTCVIEVAMRIAAAPSPKVMI